MDDFQIGVVSVLGVGPQSEGRAHNEDNYLVCQNGVVRFRDGSGEKELTHDGNGVLLAVADGMGGHHHGALASAAAVQALSRLFYRSRPVYPESTLHSFVMQGHRKLRQRVQQSSMEGLGTTLAAVWVLNYSAYWIHVGDSRIYLCRGGELSQLSRDHTHEEFARRDGRDVTDHPHALAQSFIFGSRGLGCDADVRIDAGTDTGQEMLLEGDVLLLCTDGLTGVLSQRRIAATLNALSDPDECAQQLVEQAMAAGSKDNITAVVMRVMHSPHELDTITLW